MANTAPMPRVDAEYFEVLEEYLFLHTLKDIAVKIDALVKSGRLYGQISLPSWAAKLKFEAMQRSQQSPTMPGMAAPNGAGADNTMPGPS